MDILLYKFVNKYIDKLDKIHLLELELFLNFEDDTILSYYHYNIVKKKKLIKIRFQKYLKVTKYNGGEGGIRTHERVAPLLVFKTSAFNRSATSP